MTPDEMVNKRIGQLLKTGNGHISRYLKKHEKQLVKEYLKALAGIKGEIADMFEKFGRTLGIVVLRRGIKRFIDVKHTVDCEWMQFSDLSS